MASISRCYKLDAGNFSILESNSTIKPYLVALSGALYSIPGIRWYQRIFWLCTTDAECRIINISHGLDQAVSLLGFFIHGLIYETRLRVWNRSHLSCYVMHTQMLVTFLDVKCKEKQSNALTYVNFREKNGKKHLVTLGTMYCLLVEL